VKKGCSGNGRDGCHFYLHAGGEGFAEVEFDY
jgi:hypothetical protein